MYNITYTVSKGFTGPQQQQFLTQTKVLKKTKHFSEIKKCEKKQSKARHLKRENSKIYSSFSDSQVCDESFSWGKANWMSRKCVSFGRNTRCKTDEI